MKKFELYEKFDWIPFYKEFADKLLMFKESRQILVEKIKSAFKKIEFSIPTLGSDGVFDDIDPFTVFGLFNKGITQDKRIKIIGAFKDEFNITADIPKEFYGVPVLNPLSSAFYAFETDEKYVGIDNLWSLYEAAIDVADKNVDNDTISEFKELLEIVFGQRVVKWKITLGLFWIRPEQFINLDSRNRDFLIYDFKSSEAIKSVSKLKHTISGDEYLEIIEICKNYFLEDDALFHSIPELSHFAYELSTEKKSDNWLYPDYSPEISSDLWYELLTDGVTATDNSLRMLKGMMLLGGEASCKQLADSFGGTYSVYNATSVQLADKVIAKTNCKLPTNDKNLHKWAVLFLGRHAETEETGRFIYKIRPELEQALNKIDLSNIVLSEDNLEVDKYEVNAWLLTWNPSRWEWEDFDEVVKLTRSGVAVSIGWTCANTHTLVGDRIYMVKLGSSSTPNGIFATGYIISDNYKDESYDPTKESKARYVDIILTDVRNFNKEPILEMKKLKEVFPSQNWSPQASGIAIKPYISAQLLNMWNELNSYKPRLENAENKSEEYSKYTKSDFLKDVYITESEYNKLFNLLKYKKNVILQGAPGVGKTYAAKRLAYAIMEKKDDNRVQCIQFHQSYSYEDFIEGFRPLENGGFELRKGVFKDFCQKASVDNKNDYFFIIDEINRGNMSKIFGELLMLIEADKRGCEHSLNLVYSGESFFVPENIYIIGMMNTADRSLAMIDYALRRRFSFYTIKPAFESDGFKKYAQQVNCELFHKAVEAVKNLNAVIVDDKSLGKGFEIGHSYFCSDKPENITDEIVKNIIAFEIIPTIEEYWFDNEAKLDDERQKLETLLGDDNGVV